MAEKFYCMFCLRNYRGRAVRTENLPEFRYLMPEKASGSESKGIKRRTG